MEPHLDFAQDGMKPEIDIDGDRIGVVDIGHCGLSL